MGTFLLKCRNCNSFFNGINSNVRFCSEICHFNGYTEMRPSDPNSCWLWTGPILNEYGHGFSNYNGHMPAHQRAYKMFNGPIPSGMHIRHKCNIPSCINPIHLELGTAFDNISIDRKRDGTTGKGLQRLASSGENNGNAKLTKEQVLEIYRSPGSYEEISLKFPVSIGMIKRIKTGENWWLVTGHPRRIYKKQKN